MDAVALPLPLARHRTITVLAVLLVALGAISALRPPSAAASTVSSPSIATQVLNLLNSERAANKLPALRMNAKLVAAAHGHNLAMAAANTLSHQLPGEASFSVRITKAGYVWSYAGENIAWNTDRSQSGALALQTMMYNETAPNNGHRLNILGVHFVDIGIDVALDSTHGKLWLTEDFARPR